MKFRKSAGVRVTSPVHRKIAIGNEARDRQDWSAAAGAYEAALSEDAGLYHIWLQLGHARKEDGQFVEAEQAYWQAATVAPHEVEPLLHLGHLHRSQGDMIKAANVFFKAQQRAPGNAVAVEEFHRILGETSGLSREALMASIKTLREEGAPEESFPRAVANAERSLRAVLDHLGGSSADRAEVLRSASDVLSGLRELDRSSVADDDAGALIFDASDLIGYYTHARLPTGIQRVQIEAITNALAAGDRQVRICCFINGREDWLEVPPDQFRTITRLSVLGGERDDPEWVAALGKLQLTLALAEAFVFPQGAFLINLGTSWWLQNYFLYVRNAKAKHGIRYIPFVHDFIPIITPEHCVRGLTQDFISWAVGVFDHADHFLVNSEATKRDLLKVAAVLGHDVDPEDVAVIPLDADFRKPDVRQLGQSTLANWRLDEQPFVLLVSTIESRKGHVVAMDAWLELIRRYGTEKVPRLVCVGKNGWLNDAVYQRLQHNDELAKRVTMLSYLSDDELALLYRSCQFTIYPSLYEGWGLPITEALCYGKAVVAANNSSLPEAGGRFALYVETASPLQLADAVAKLSFDDAYRTGLEDRIRSEFKARSWSAVARQIDDEIIRLTSRNHGDTRRVPTVTLGAFHPVKGNAETRIWPGLGSGEIFRTGLGWLWPAHWGCWTRPQGGELTLGLPAGHGPLRVYLLLQNFPNHSCPWRLNVTEGPTLRGDLANGERKWISFDYPAYDGDGTLVMHLRGDWSESVRMNTAGTEKDYTASVGVIGFFVCEADDALSRTALLEAAALGNIDDLNAYRENPLRDDKRRA